jgi:group I intron endonuclease
MYVYIITNRVNGKSYVGQTLRRPIERMRSHRYAASLKFGARSDMVIARAIRTYGWDSFSWRVIEICQSQELLDAAESYWIEKYRTVSPDGYNIALGGRGRGSVSDETRKRISEAGRGRLVGGDTRKKLSDLMKSRVRSPETAKKIGQANLGRKASVETKIRQSEAIKALGGSHMVEWTPERREKLASARRGKLASQETKEKLSRVRSGENGPSAKLNWSQVVEIRRICAEKTMSQREVAEMFNVSQGVVSKIHNFQTWKTNDAA